MDLAASTEITSANVFSAQHGKNVLSGPIWRRKRVLILTALLFILSLVIGSTFQPFTRNLVPFTPGARHLLPSKDNETLCKFPQLDPFDPAIQKYIHKHGMINCEKEIPTVVYVDDNQIMVDEKKVKAKVSSGSIDFCKYRNITMTPGTDYEIEYGAWSDNFNSSKELLHTEEHLQVECFHKAEIVSRSYHAIVRMKPEIEKARLEGYKKHLETHSPKETLSIMFIGMDGMSKENLVRTMPKTRSFLLQNLKAIEYKQFNKVGLNTFPNVFPMLTGKHEEELTNFTTKTPFNKIGHLFAWNYYQKAGYRTAILFDNVYITAFNYLREGWDHPPFDFYPRPVTVASERDEDYTKDKDCRGDTPEITNMLNYWLQFAELYNNTPSTPYFTYCFLNRLTHDAQDRATAGDELYLQFFQKMSSENVLTNTLLIFFSDHGARFGDFRKTYNGVFEARNPMLFFVFPPWFEGKYPKVMINFRKNVHRLTTVFDIFATLEDLLVFTGKPEEASPLARGISLFSEIPTNRTCQVAGIPMKFCGCNAISREKVANPNITKAVEEKFLNIIVGKSENQRDKCETLELKETLSVHKMMMESGFENKNEAMYHVTIKTRPGDALYEAALWHDTQTKSTSIVGEISRLNMYKGQAECVDNLDLRSFCYCKNSNNSTEGKTSLEVSSHENNRS